MHHQTCLPGEVELCPADRSNQPYAAMAKRPQGRGIRRSRLYHNFLSIAGKRKVPNRMSMDSRKVPTRSTTFHAPCATWNVVDKMMEGTFHNVPLGLSALTPVKGRRLPLFPTTDHHVRRGYSALKPQTWRVRFPYGDRQTRRIAPCTLRLDWSSTV